MVRGLDFPRCFKLATISAYLSLAGFAFAALEGADLVPFGHLKLPFWLRKTLIFSFRDMLPSSMLRDLQQATQLSSPLAPPLALATRCSTLASAPDSGCAQKKHNPP